MRKLRGGQIPVNRMPAQPDWSTATAPSLDDIERLAAEAYARLPRRFRDLTGDLVIRVVDFPDEETLDNLGLESPFDLLGLYHGISMANKSVLDTPSQPDMVFLYRRPLLDYWAEDTGNTLGELVTHVLVHEIGHHFGLSDEDMERIEAEAG